MENHINEMLSNQKCLERHILELKKDVADLTQVIYKGNGKSLITRMELVEIDKKNIMQGLSEKSKEIKTLNTKLNKVMGTVAASILFVVVLAIDANVGKQIVRYFIEIIKFM